jgi:hypothetical protein
MVAKPFLVPALISGVLLSLPLPFPVKSQPAPGVWGATPNCICWDVTNGFYEGRFTVDNPTLRHLASAPLGSTHEYTSTCGDSGICRFNHPGFEGVPMCGTVRGVLSGAYNFHIGTGTGWAYRLSWRSGFPKNLLPARECAN